MSSETSVVAEFLEAWEEVTAFYQGNRDHIPDSGILYTCIVFVEYLHDLIHAPDIDDETRRHAVHLKATVRLVLLEILRAEQNKRTNGNT